MRADSPRLEQVPKDSVYKLSGLANLMQKRRRSHLALTRQPPGHDAPRASARDAIDRTIIVPFVGAGASAAAGLPSGQQLKEAIWEAVLRFRHPSAEGSEAARVPRAGEAAAALDALFRCEAQAAFGRVPRRLTDLTLFELASVLSATEFGRQAIRACLRRSLPDDIASPLPYELLAHLAKHDYIDDMVSLNFDTLLERSLRDELPERIRVIDGSFVIPGDASRLRTGDNVRFLLKPFGSVDVDFFRLRPEELQRYGESSVWHFMLRHVFRGQGGDESRTRAERRRASPDDASTIVLLLVGYAAAESAFTALVRDLRAEHPLGKLKIFSINIRAPSPELERLRQERLVDSVEWIRTDAGVGLSLLLQLLEHGHREPRGVATWIPVARHEVIATCFSDRRTNQPSKRFAAEVVLQAVKGRGFFTVESIADVQRIPVPPGGAGDALKHLVEHKLLRLHRGGAIHRAGPRFLRADFELAERDHLALAAVLLRELELPADRLVPEYRLEFSRAGIAVRARFVRLDQYLADRFRVIGNAPQIEVSHSVSPSTPWMFARSSTLRSVTELQEWTSELLAEARRARVVEVTGVWTTGEWLFHEDGWAYASFGEELVSRAREGTASIRVVLASFDEHQATIRGARAREVNRRLDPVMQGVVADHVEQAVPGAPRRPDPRLLRPSVRYLLDWWLHNRCLTLVRWGDSGERLDNHRGVYFRQRHGSPIVAPVALWAREDCGVLDDLFEYYRRKAGSVMWANSPTDRTQQPAPSAPVTNAPSEPPPFGGERLVDVVVTRAEEPGARQKPARARAGPAPHPRSRG